MPQSKPQASATVAGLADISAVARCLRKGGVALLPTDTVYGLAVLPARQEAVERLYRMKSRPHDRSLPVMVADPRELARMGVVAGPQAAPLLAPRFMPGPLTLVLGFGDGPRPLWLAGRTEVALRIPDNPWLRRLLRRCGPLCVTSANPHGLPTPETPAEILALLPEQPDIVVDDGPRRGAPSTLVNCLAAPPVVERAGPVPPDELAALLG